MKKFKYIAYTAVGLFAATISSCNKLEEYNPGGATADAAYTTPQGFLTLVNAAYGETRYMYGKEDYLFLGESGTDIWINENNGTYAQQLTKYNSLTPSNGNPFRNLWPKIWKGINHCNAGIDRIDNAGFASETEKNQRLGELRFLRAFYYWHIVEQWGGVMLRTHEVNTPELLASRSSVEDFYNLIIDDLLFAKDNLPLSWGAEYSRATRKSAMGLLARAYLSRAYYSTGADADAWFTKAKDMANEVIEVANGWGVAMWATPAELWDPKNNKRNQEALFVVSNSALALTTNYDNRANVSHNWYMNNYVGKPGLVGSTIYGRPNGRRLMPTLFLLNLYNESIDARYEASFREKFYSNSRTGANHTPFVWDATFAESYNKDKSVVGKTIDSLDLALEVTKRVVPNKKTVTHVVIDRDDIYEANGAAKNNSGVFGSLFPVLQKFVDPYRADFTQEAGYQDIMIIRLAEMHMIAAEAYFRLSDLAAAAESINVIRKRAAKPGQEAAMAITAGDVTESFILDEWAREFCGEFLRWPTLKRMLKGQAFVDRIKLNNPNITAVEEFHRLRPVPQVELDALLNGKEFGQNPGYQ